MPWIQIFENHLAKGQNIIYAFTLYRKDNGWKQIDSVQSGTNYYDTGNTAEE